MFFLHVWMLRRWERSCTSRTEIGSSRLLGIVVQPMYVLIPVIRQLLSKRYTSSRVMILIPPKENVDSASLSMKSSKHSFQSRWSWRKVYSRSTCTVSLTSKIKANHNKWLEVAAPSIPKKHRTGVAFSLRIRTGLSRRERAVIVTLVYFSASFLLHNTTAKDYCISSSKYWSVALANTSKLTISSRRLIRLLPRKENCGLWILAHL
jgi:hypothetical protein